MIKVFKLKSSNVHIFNKIFYKRDNPTFSSKTMPLATLEVAEKAGFLELDSKLSKEATKKFNTTAKGKALADEAAKVAADEAAKVAADEAAKVADCEFPEDMPARQLLIDNKITTFEQLKGVNDLTTIKGIGGATAKEIIDFIAE